MLQLQQYGGDSDEESHDSADDTRSHLKPLEAGKTIDTLHKNFGICAAPDVVPSVSSSS